jgi:hypothetical protein
MAEDYFSNLDSQDTTTDTLPGDYFSNIDNVISSGDYFSLDAVEDVPSVVYDEEFANSWSNRFSIATDNMQSSLYKGLNLVADSLDDYFPDSSADLKNYALKGIERNQQEAASHPPPSRNASFTDRYGEIKSDFNEGEILEGLKNAFILAKDLSAEALPSIGVSGAALLGSFAAAPIIGAIPVVGGTAATLTTLIAPLIPGFLMGGGETYEEAQRLGATPDEAQKISLTAGGIIGIMDRISAGAALNGVIKSFGKDAVFNVVSKQIGKGAAKEAFDNAAKVTEKNFIKKSIAANVVKTAGKSAIIEGATEAGQERVQIAAAGEAADLGMSPYSSAEINKRMIDAAALGVIGGKIMGTGAGVVQGIQHNNVAKRSEEIEEEINKLESSMKGLDKDQLAKNIVDYKGQYKPSIIQSLIGKSLTPLQYFANRSDIGLQVVNRFENYFNNVNSDIGNYSKQIDDAFQTIRRSFKLPLIMGSMSSTRNKELYNVLVYNKLSTDSDINQAATLLRDQVLGNIIQDEVKITDKSILNSLKNNSRTLNEIDKGIQSKTLDQNTATELNSLYNNLITTYNNELNNIIGPNVEQKQGKIIANLKKSNEFKKLNNVITVPLQGTGLFQVMRNAGLDVNFEEEYLPRLYKFNTPFRWRKATKILAERLGQTEASSIVDNIRSNEGIHTPEAINLDFDLEGKSFSESTESIEKSRRIDKETFKALDDAGLVENNVKNIIDKYMLQAIQRGNVKELKNYVEPKLKQLQEQGGDAAANPNEVQHMKNLYAAFQNRYKPIQVESFKKGSRMYLTFQYMLTLPLAALTALTEPIIILSRLGIKDSIYGLTKASQNLIRQAGRSIFPKLKKSESEQAFNSMLQGYDGILAERLGSIAGVDVSRTITDKFFKTIMLSQITQLSRDIAFQAGQKQIKEDIVLIARNQLSKGRVTKKILDARRRLLQQGLVPKNLGLDTPNTSEALLWAEGQTTGVPPAIIRKSLSKFVDEIIMAPNAINRPLWMSNPHLAVFAQLKGFMFTFGSTVGMRMYREVFKPLAKGRIPLDEAATYALAFILIAAGSIGIRELKDQIRYGDEPSNWKDLEGFEVWRQALLASNIFGPGTILDQALNSTEYGTRPFMVLSGPGVQYADKLVEALGQYGKKGNKKALVKFIAESFPGVAAITPSSKPDIQDFFTAIIPGEE